MKGGDFYLKHSGIAYFNAIVVLQFLYHGISQLALPPRPGFFSRFCSLLHMTNTLLIVNLKSILGVNILYLLVALAISSPYSYVYRNLLSATDVLKYSQQPVTPCQMRNLYGVMARKSKKEGTRTPE